MLPFHFEACGTSDTFHHTLEQRRPSCESAACILSHFYKPKFDRRTPAVDHQNQHVSAIASQSAPQWYQSSCHSERCVAAFGPLPSNALLYLPIAAAALHLARW